MEDTTASNGENRVEANNGSENDAQEDNNNAAIENESDNESSADEANNNENNNNDGLMTFHQTVASGLVAATSNYTAMQLRGLTIVRALTSGAHETIKTELGNAGVIELMARILDGGVATEGASKAAILRTRELTTEVIWSLSIGHVENKKRGNAAVIPLVKQLSRFLEILEKARNEETTAAASLEQAQQQQQSQETTQLQTTQQQQQTQQLEILDNEFPDNLHTYIEHILQETSMALWSLCYGIRQNQELLYNNNGVSLLTRELKLKNALFETKYAATGALWHLSSYQPACEDIAESNITTELVDIARSDEKDALVPCLALSRLVNHSKAESSQRIIDSGALRVIKEWVARQDIETYKSSFVWTTLEPLVDLLASKSPEINELGCFLTCSEVCHKSEISKMFTEGVVQYLKNFIGDSNSSDVAKKYASYALTKLGIDVEEIQRRSKPYVPALLSVESSDLKSWLKTLGLEEYYDILEQNKINLDNIDFLKSEDLEKTLHLPLGPRRKLMGVIESRKRHREQDYLVPPHPAATGVCSICCDSPKEMCFVPCGHVVTCETCAQIIKARDDPCPICRKPVKEFVRPFYV